VTSKRLSPRPILALALIEEYNNGDGTTVLTNTTATNQTVLTKADYEAAGITGVSDTTVDAGTSTDGTDNLAAVNAQVLLSDSGDANTVAKIQSLVSAGNDAITYVTGTVANEIGTSDASTGTLSEQAQLDAYTAAGITGVSADNLLAVNAQLRLETTSTNKDSVGDIQAIVTKANTALALIEEYNNGDGITVLTNTTATNQTVLTKADYEAVGITGVSDTTVDAGTSTDGTDNLAAVNAQVLLSDSGDANTVAKIQSLVSAGNDAITYLITTIQPLTTAPADGTETGGEVSVDDQLAAYTAAGITGVSADNLLAVNAQLRLETTATDKDSVSDIQAIVTKANTALALIEEYNNGDGTTVLANSNTTLTIPDYEAAGIVGVDANNLFSVNRLMLAASTGGADTVGEIQSIAAAGIQAHQDALAKISAFADTLATSTETVAGDTDDKEVLTLTLPSLTAQAGYTLKVGNVIVESGALDADPTPAELVTALQSDSAYTLSPFTVALHQTNTNDLVITFKNVGERTAVAELRSEMPVVVDYENAGATGADAENLYAINDGLMTRTSTQADSTTEVQSLVTASEVVHTNALTQVLNYAAGTNTTKPSVKTYKLAGLTAVTESNLTAVNKIVEAQDSSTINDYATAASFVNAGVQAYEAALLTLADYANEVGGAATPDLTDYETAGITGLQAGDIDMINALMIQRETADDGIATTTTGIQSIVNKGLAAIFKIRDAAQNNTAGNNTDPADDLTATDYEAVGVPTTDLVNVGALNDALDSVAVTGADVRAYADLMAVVDAVKAVDALADATDDNGTVDLTAEDFAAMGVTGLDTTTTPESDEQVARLAILNDVLDRKDNSTAYPGGNADTVAEVQALHDAAQALLRTAQGETPKITEVQLELLGFTTLTASDITANNLSAIQQVLINTYTANSDFTGINTLAKVETLTKNAVDALEAIKANAAANNSATDTTNTGLDLNGASTGLDAADFAAMGVSTVTDSGTGSANNQAMVLSVLDSTAITAAEVTTYEEVQAIVDSVNTILTYVENGTDAPKLSDFTTLGLANITTADQLTLINSYLNDTNTVVADIDSYDELQARLTAVKNILTDAAVADLAAEEGIDDVVASYVTTSANLEALGFTYVDTSTTTATLVSAGQATTEVTPENLASVHLAIANSANDLSELQSFSALKTLIEETAKAANTIQAYGAADSSSATPVPTVADYAAIGVTGVTSLNVAAINSSLAEAGVLDTISNSVASDVQDIVDTWAKVEALADGEVDTVEVGTSTSTLSPTSLSAEAVGTKLFSYTALNSGTSTADHPDSFVIEGRSAGGEWKVVKSLTKETTDLLPTFTSEVTDGYKITANYRAAYYPWRVADDVADIGSTTSEYSWVDNNEPATLTIELPQREVVYGYTLRAGHFSYGFPDSWDFQGLDWRGEWVTLDARSGQQQPDIGADNSYSYPVLEYFISNPGEYSAYRFANMNSPHTEIVLGEIQLKGYAETVASTDEFEEYQVKVGEAVIGYADYEVPKITVTASAVFDENASTAWSLPDYSDEGYAYVDLGAVKSFDTVKVELPSGNNAPDTIEIYGADSPIDFDNIGAADLLVSESIDVAQLEASGISGQGILSITPETKFSHRYIAVKVIGDGVYEPKINEISLSNTESIYTVYTADVDGPGDILVGSDGYVGKDNDIALLTATEFASIGIKSRDGSSNLSSRAAELLNQLIDERGLNAVDNTAEIKALAVAIEALLETAAITDGTATATSGDITQAQLNLLGLSLIDGNNVGGIITYLKGSGGDGSSSNPDYSQTLHIAQIRADLVSAITGLTELEKAAELNNATSSYPLAAHWNVINSLTSAVGSDEVASDDVDSFNSMLNTQAVDGIVAADTASTSASIVYPDDAASSVFSDVTGFSWDETNGYYRSVDDWGAQPTITLKDLPDPSTITSISATFTSYYGSSAMGRSYLEIITDSGSKLIGTVDAWEGDSSGQTIYKGDQPDEVNATKDVIGETYTWTIPKDESVQEIRIFSSYNHNYSESIRGIKDISIDYVAYPADGLLSRIIDYNAVLDAADSGTADTTLALSADEYARIGITGLDITTSPQPAKQTAKLAILNEVIEGLAKTTVDTIPKLQLVFNAADALLRTVDGETPAITQPQLELLGFTGVTADNLSAIQKALSDVDTATDYAAVDSLSEVTAIVNDAISALAAISDAALDNDADSRTDGVDTTAGLTADDFVAMGVEGVDATNLSLILSALNDTDIDNTDIFNLETTQALVTAAAKVVALAGNATAPKLVAADLTKLGLDLSELDSGNVKANAIALLNDLLIADSTAQTAVADIQVLVDAWLR
jgi:hypothetical protein